LGGLFVGLGGLAEFFGIGDGFDAPWGVLHTGPQ